jgi:hypothetical protein
MPKACVVALCLLAGGAAHAYEKTVRVWLSAPAATASRLDALAASKRGIANGNKPRFFLTDRKEGSSKQSGGADGLYAGKQLSFTLKQGGVVRGSVEVLSESNTSNPGWREEHWLRVKAPSRRAANMVIKAVEAE